MAAALKPTRKDSQCHLGVFTRKCYADPGFDAVTCERVRGVGPCYSKTAPRCKQDSECAPDSILGVGALALTCSNTNPDEGSYYCRKNNALEILVGKSECQCVIEQANVVTWPSVFKNSDANIPPFPPR